MLPLIHPFAKAESITLQKLYRDLVLLLDRDTIMYSLCLKKYRSVGFEPHFIFADCCVDSIISLVSKGWASTF